MTPGRRGGAAVGMVIALVLLAGCGASGGHPGDRSTAAQAPATAKSKAPALPPLNVPIPVPKARKAKTIPAPVVARAYAQSAALLSAMYTNTTSLTGSSAPIMELAGPVGQTLTASPRTSIAAHPVFPPGAVRLGQFAVQRSAFSARQVRCNFAFCEGGGFAGERTVALVVHWSGAVRYPLTLRASDHEGTVAGRYEVDLFWIVRFLPANPVFLGKQPAEPTTVTAGYLPVLSACVGKGLVVPPDPPPPLKATDYAPPTRATSTGAPGPCPA
jgi:hypothetical protein